VLSGRAEPSADRQALDAGATGYTLKRGTYADLLTAIRTSPMAGATSTPDLGEAHRPIRHGPLSPRELDVLRPVALGHRSEEISEQLSITTRTTEMHRASVKRKLQLETRAQLVSHALANGLIGPG